MTDLLLMSLGTTRGLRLSDAQFASMARAAGASISVAGTRIGVTDRLRRGYPVNDIVEALAVRQALRSAVRRARPRAIVFSSTTAALLAGGPAVPFAVWFDSPACLNRPGARNSVLHRLERRSLSRARVVLPWSPSAVVALPRGAAPAVVLPPPLAYPSSPGGGGRHEELVVAYTPDVKAKGLELVCRAWAAADTGAARLVIVGAQVPYAREFLARSGVALPPGAELAGMLPEDEFRALLGRARVYLSAARWEDFGKAPLEALDRGAVLVCAPGGGPFPALEIARRLAPPLVAADRSPVSVAAALEAGLGLGSSELEAYRQGARAALEIYRPDACVARLRDEVLPLLLG